MRCIEITDVMKFLRKKYVKRCIFIMCLALIFSMHQFYKLKKYKHSNHGRLKKPKNSNEFHKQDIKKQRLNLKLRSDLLLNQCKKIEHQQFYRGKSNTTLTYLNMLIIFEYNISITFYPKVCIFTCIFACNFTCFTFIYFFCIFL